MTGSHIVPRAAGTDLAKVDRLANQTLSPLLLAPFHGRSNTILQIFGEGVTGHSRTHCGKRRFFVDLLLPRWVDRQWHRESSTGPIRAVVFTSEQAASDNSTLWGMHVLFLCLKVEEFFLAFACAFTSTIPRADGEFWPQIMGSVQPVSCRRFIGPGGDHWHPLNRKEEVYGHVW